MKKEKSVSDEIKHIAETLTSIGVIGGIGYGIGRWQSHMEHKAEIIELRQQYNDEISSLKNASNIGYGASALFEWDS